MALVETPEKMGIIEEDKEEYGGEIYHFNFREAELKLEKYKDRFEEIKKIEDPNTRKAELEKLLKKYSEDLDIKKLAEIYAMDCSREAVENFVYEKYPNYSETDKRRKIDDIVKEKVKKVEDLSDLRSNILGEIRKYKKYSSSLEELEEKIDYAMKNPFRYALGIAYEKAMELTPRELRERFTI